VRLSNLHSHSQPPHTRTPPGTSASSCLFQQAIPFLLCALFFHFNHSFIQLLHSLPSPSLSRPSNPLIPSLLSPSFPFLIPSSTIPPPPPHPRSILPLLVNCFFLLSILYTFPIYVPMTLPLSHNLHFLFSSSSQ